MALPDVTEEELQDLYSWVDTISLSRQKKSIQRDFADGVLMAEIVHHYFPRLVELHNYSPAHNTAQKLYNWQTLNQRVFRRLGCVLPREVYEPVANAEAGAVERVLKLVRTRLARFQEQQQQGGSGGSGGRGSRPGSDMASAAFQACTSPAGMAPYPMAALEGPPCASDLIAAVRLAGPTTSGASAAARAPAPLEQSLRANLADREQQVQEMRETNELLETKISKLEQLVRLKDAKIQALLGRLAVAPDGAAAEPKQVVEAGWAQQPQAAQPPPPSQQLEVQ